MASNLHGNQSNGKEWLTFIQHLSPMLCSQLYFADEETPSRGGVTCLALHFLPIPQTPSKGPAGCHTDGMPEGRGSRAQAAEQGFFSPGPSVCHLHGFPDYETPAPVLSFDSDNEWPGQGLQLWE